MTIQDEKSLGALLWGIANDLRGSMDADDFRDYMLAFLFLSHLSENYEHEAKGQLKDEYLPLSEWYQEHPKDTDEFEEMMRRRVYYVIHPDYLWDTIVGLAREQNEKLLKTVADAFDYIEKTSFGENFEGLFSEIRLNSDKLGRGYKERNDKLGAIISKIAEKLPKHSSKTDMLGDAYEYLLDKFAAGGGRKAGEFFTPQRISEVLSSIAILDGKDPSNGTRPRPKTVLDFACGSGSLLLNVRRTAGMKQISKIYGQEKNTTTYSLARMNMLLHGLHSEEFHIFHGDTLTNDWGLLNTTDPTKKIKFDVVVANPPFSLKWQPDDELRGDPRFKDYDLAPKSAADFAFMLHGFHYLAEDGVMAIIMPHGVLFRGGAEGKIRKQLVKKGVIDTVIGLPPNLFYSTGIPVCILVLKKCASQKDVLFINASEDFEKGKRQNRLREEDFGKIVQTYRNREEIERYSRRVKLDEIRENNYNLNITRYVSTATPEPPVDLDKVHRELTDSEQQSVRHKKRHNKYLKELGLPPLP